MSGYDLAIIFSASKRRWIPSVLDKFVLAFDKFLVMILYYLFFRFLTYPYFQRTTRAPGPASRTLYDVGFVLPDPEMICQDGLRLKISQAVSHLFFLKPHALILSHIESRPLSDYFSRTAYDRAQLLYFGGSSPGVNLVQCQRAIHNLRL